MITSWISCPMTVVVREIDAACDAEVSLVASRMRQTLVEVEGEEAGTALYSMEWLRERVRWHLDGAAIAAKVYVAEDSEGNIVGHTIVRRELDEGGSPFGLVSTTFVSPESRRAGIGRKLLDAGERWFVSQGLHFAATWTSSTNIPLIRLYEKHGYAPTATHTHDGTGTLMVRLQRAL